MVVILAGRWLVGLGFKEVEMGVKVGEFGVILVGFV